MPRGRSREDYLEDLYEDDFGEPEGRGSYRDEPDDDEDLPRGEDDDEDPDAEDPDDEDEEDAEDEPRGRRSVGSIINRIKAQMGQHTRRLVDELRLSGLDYQNGRVVIRNRALAASALGYDPGAAGTEAPKAVVEPVAEEQLGEMPDPSAFPEEFAAWLQKRDTISAKRLTDQVTQGMEQMTAPIARRQIKDAIDIADEILPKYGLAHMLDHPDFEKAFGEALRQSGIPVQHWTDETILARVAGIVNAELALTAPPRRRRRERDEEPEEEIAEEPRRRREAAPPRRSERGERSERADATERGRQRDTGRAAVSRAGYAQIGSSRGSGRTPERGSFSAAEVAGAKTMGITPKMYRALGDETGEAFVPQLIEEERRRRAGSQPRRTTSRNRR